MKKIKILIIGLFVIALLSGCSLKSNEKKELDISQIRTISDLATIETYYHNVAKLNKEKSNIFAQDRELWIEYTGTGKVGIEMSKVDMKMSGNKVIITIPPAKLLSFSVDENKISDDNYYYNSDNKWLFKNEISIEEETAAINVAQENMKKDIEGNTALLNQAQNRAKDLIEKYIIQISSISEKEYKIEWIYDKNEN